MGEKIRRILKNSGCDFVVINRESSLKYLTNAGFATETAYLISDNKKKVLFVTVLDGSYKTVETKKYKSISDIKKWIKENMRGVAGFDVGTYDGYLTVKKILAGQKKKDIRHEVDSLSAVKTEEEIKKIKKATKVTKNAIDFGMSNFKKNMTEKNLASMIKSYITSKNMDYSFCTAQGDKNSAIPHHLPDSTKIKRIVVVDVGATCDGYSSDISRTFLINPTKEMKKVYKIVEDAQKKSIDAVEQGVTAKAVDKAGRDHILSNNYEFIHSTGHGVGLIDHGHPKISPRSAETLKQRMVFTIEPGIYLPNKFGVRIEDVFVVRKNKAQML